MNSTKSKPVSRELLIALFVIAAAVFGNWLASVAQKIMMLGLALLTNKPKDENALQLADFLFLVLTVGGMVCSTWFLYHYRRVLFGAQVASFTRAENTPRPCVVFLVSPQRIRERDGTFKERLQHDSDGWFIDQPANRLTGDVHKDIQAINNFKLVRQWPWQQILRGLEPHLNQVQRIWLVVSKAPDGSAPELPLLLQFLGSYSLSDRLHADPFREWQGDLDFEDFATLRDRLRAIMDEENRLFGRVDESRIVIDATGGQKTTSIAAAAVTLNSNAVFQYVQTSDPFKVLTYDILFQTQEFYAG